MDFRPIVHFIYRKKVVPKGRLLVLLFLFCLAHGASATPYERYQLTRWYDPLGRSPQSFQDFHRKITPVSKFIIGEVALNNRPCTKKVMLPKGGIAILVNADLFPKIASSLMVFSDDLSSQGYSVVIDTIRGGDASDLRSFLLGQWAINNLQGAVFVGDLPLAWFKMHNSWDDWEEFPIDYYFMDLDGNWADVDDDGLFDTHSGATQPEIWVGRLSPSFLTWDCEENLLDEYFTKNHHYRIGELSLPRRALAYDDDDWAYAGDAHLSMTYDSVTVVTLPWETTALGYTARLGQGYEFIHLMAHSSPWTHTFFPWGQGGTVYNYEIHLLEPKAFFYNLFACSNARWIEQDNIASWYIFSNPYGLLAVGTTKTGSMLYFEDFYGPLGEGQSLGEAFKSWLTLHGEEDPSWFYGMTLLGDPTLHLQGDSQGTFSEDDRPPTTQDPSWTTYRITDNPYTDGDPRLATDGSGTIYLVWTSGRDIRSNIYESHFTDESWSPPQPVCPHEYWDLDPSICGAADGSVWIAWHSLRSGGVHNIFASYTDDEGANWSPAMQVTDDVGYDVDPHLVMGPEGRPWIFFKSWRDANANIYLSRYDDGWSSPEKITVDPGDDVSPHAVTDGDGNVWVVWSSNREENWDIFARYRTQDSLSSILRITSHPQADILPILVHDNSGCLWILWQSFRDGDANIYASRFDGQSWSSPFAVTTDTADDLSPSAAPFGSQGIIITWRSNRGQSWSIYQRHLEDQSWSPPTMISTEGGDNIAPAVCQSPQGTSWIAWGSNDGTNWEIYASRHQQTEIREDDPERLPGQFSLSQNFPNPFNTHTSIQYAIPEVVSTNRWGQGYHHNAGGLHIALKIYNILGQEVKTLSDAMQGPGQYSILWDGTDAAGREVGSGIYLYSVSVTGEDFKMIKAKKMVLLK